MALQKGAPSIIVLGFDGNDNFLGTYPTLAALQAEYPTASSGNFAYVDDVGVSVIQYVWDVTEGQWVAGATVGGITSVNGNAGPIVVLTADDIGDDATAHKFVTQGDLTKLGFITITSALNLNTMNQGILDNAQAISNNADAINNLGNNKVEKPAPAGSFEKDIMSRTSVAGSFAYLTPKNGVVKLNSVVTNTVVTDGTKFKIVNQVGSVFSTATNFPKNISNQYPGQDPINNYATFIPELYNATDDKWLENPVDKQFHLWRVTVLYTKSTNQANKLIFSLENPLSGFILQEAFGMPDKAPFQTFEKSFLVGTIADSNSIGEGYELFITPDGENVTLDRIDVTRFSAEII